ncbi:molybdopterin-dependent oxidoreductase [Agromyces sp. S2-1-8]|uniref:molybdopterin-dependent oxidoreductase n=1 Tax=Agromyces sp. S2-1-8 TaxID=2897180 RepID=UPI001E4772B6|nr:molybdopterin-dependent oxidoreductase [Agromyces sp. S2-1-8]MCD5345956.1 molybdopterin-dependent oxidoreductase [Agromyces sp. S2-1-8]
MGDARSTGWLLPAAAGAAAAVFGAGLGELVAAVIAPESGPVVVIGSALIDLAPPWAKDAAIALFGTADKLALVTGIVLVLLVAACGAGVLESRRPPWGSAVFAVFGVAGAVAAATRANAPMLAVVPSLVAGAAAVVALRVLVRRLAAVAGVETSRRPASTAPGETPASATPAATGETPASATPAAARETPAPTAPTTAHEALAPATPATTRETSVPASGTRTTRRAFLGWAGGAAVIGALAAIGGAAIQAGGRAVTAVREAIRLPTPTSRASVPPGADLGIDGLAPVITPNADFYRIDTALAVPVLDPAEWKLRVHGMVEQEFELTWDELLALPLAESVATLACVSNEVGGDLIGNAVWLGYPIRELLARARPLPDADMVLSRSSDGFTASTPIEVLQDDRDAILAVGMNGEPLPIEHGFPVRMVVPGLYGYVSATKWVVDLEVTRFDRARAYWTDRGWSDHGPIKLSSRIDVPRRGQSVEAGDVVVAGVAWHQHTGIEGVEVQVDEGAWRPAELATAISDDTWVQWRFAWPDASSGSHTLRVRATGADGELQTAEERPVVPDGATGLHEITVDVR